MSNWKVSKEKITLFPHPNADKLQLGKVGTYQVVVQKGIYADGDEVVFVPEKSILTGVLLDEFRNYLVGPNKDRVKAIALRGELSSGIILSPELVAKATGNHLNVLPLDEDLSERMGITKYEPPIPTHLSGQVEPIADGVQYGQHDCEQFGVYADQLQEGEDVVITEKLHGSQVIIFWDTTTDYQFVTSKGLLGKGLCLTESETNAYWRAAAPIWKLILDSFAAEIEVFDLAGVRVQVFGELVPCQGANWSYGFTEPTIRVFDVRVNGKSVPWDLLDTVWAKVWVPILHFGAFNAAEARALREGMERVSGERLHIREGVVVRPWEDRRASDGTRLVLKVINPAYKETGEEIN